MSTETNPIKLAVEIRRYTRDPKVIALCDLVISGVPANHMHDAIMDTGRVYEGDPLDRKKFDKTEYMRDYMRKLRAQKKANG